MIRIAVVDDVKIFAYDYRKDLEQLFKQHSVECEIDVYTEAYYFQGILRDKKYNLIFLDIDMPEINGIDLAKEIRKNYGDEKVKLVFVSSYENFVFETFHYKAYRFIRKIAVRHKRNG